MSGTTLHKGTGTGEHYIVSIGASAGGLEAIHEFFDNTPESGNLSYIVIQHLSPDHKSLLVELLSRHTHMKVFEARHNMLVQRNCVYVIPNNKIMTIAGGRLQLVQKSGEKLPNTAVDAFLHTLAADKGLQAIAVILSGTGTDGTKGITSIKQAGGMVMVQDPATAKFDGMPNTAIASDQADHILPPELMPAEILNYINESPVHVLRNGRIEEELLLKIFQLIDQHSSHDFTAYKYPTLIRRISHRMMQHKIASLEEYVNFLYTHPEECIQLYRDFLIGVTGFYRDKGAYDVLYREVLPELIKAKNPGEQVKIWVTACSSGEEAYSIAILLDMLLKTQEEKCEVKIFATDADNEAVEKAAKGVFYHDISKEMEPEILKEYFLQIDGQFCIIPRIRKQIVFGRHNIIKDPPFIRNDLVTCRNMLIYMNSTLQKKVLSTLSFALNTGGFLFLGSSENAAPVKENLEEVNSKWRIYRKNTRPAGYAYDAGLKSFVVKQATTNLLPGTITQAGLMRKSARRIEEDFREIVSEDHGFAGIYIDGNYTIKDAIGNYTRYISLPENRLDLNVLQMIIPELSAPLGKAIRKAWKEQKKTLLKNIPVGEKHKARRISITVKPAQDAGNSYTFVLFGESREGMTDKDTVNMTASIQSMESNQEAIELQHELNETRNQLQTVLENFETTSEELQSSNEELLSANEELQSSNEELQSLNEELHTLNTEHQMKIRELIDLNDDMNNYFRSIDIGQVFLDANLRIRKFNPAAVKMINIIDGDIGRPISHISTNIRHDNLLADIQSVVDNGTLVEKEVQLLNGNTSLMRMLPYLRRDKHTDGVVITFVDISAIRHLHQIITGIFNSSLSAILAFTAVRDQQGHITDFTLIAANHAADKLLGFPHEQGMHQSLRQAFPHLVENGLWESYVDVAEHGNTFHKETYIDQHNDLTFFEVVAVKMMDGIAVTFTDITEKKDAEKRLQKNYNELIKVKENLKALNADLEDRVRERTRSLTESEERFRIISKATNDTLWDWNLATNTIWWSENFSSMYGYAWNEEKQNISFLLDKIHMEDRNRVKESLFNAVNQSREQWSSEYRFLKADGTYARILDRGYLLKDEHDMPYRMLGSMLDVTNLRKAEAEVSDNIEQKKFLAEAMPLIVWAAAPDGQIDFLNQQFSVYTGVSAGEGSKKDWRHFIHKDDMVNLSSLWKQALNNKTDFTTEVRVKRKDGVYRWNLLRARAKKEAGDKLVFWVGTNTDIHEQRMATEILEQRVKERTRALELMNKQLEESNYELQQYAYVASHDLKEPLRKINMFGNILRDKFFQNEASTVKDYLDRIIKSSTRMMQLIDDLLSFSNLSVSNMFERVELNRIIQDIISDLEVTIQEKKAVISAGELPSVEVVPAQMRQVFQNLISNALKFSRRDVQPEIHITSAYIESKSFDSRVSEDGGFCRILVSDNGIGFDELYVDKIFTLFQRLHTREFEGTGIGLAIAQKIILKHNGLITARSRENEGSTFIIILPLQQISSPSAHQQIDKLV